MAPATLVKREQPGQLVYEELWPASMGIEADLFLHRILRPEHFAWGAWEEDKSLIASAVDFEHWRLITASGYAAVHDARELCEEEIAKAGSRKLSDASNAERRFEQLTDLQRSIASARELVGDLIKGYEWDVVRLIVASRRDGTNPSPSGFPGNERFRDGR